MSSARYTVGIDLGTSHTVVAYADLWASDASGDSIHLLPIDQLIAPGEVAAPALLPSVRYHPAEGELSATQLALPWHSAETAVLGRYARDLGSQVPARLVSSAKSWLSHPGVDRNAAILPWGAEGAEGDIAKISPVAASASYLAHVHAAWNARFPDAPLAQQDIVLTVPASFDEGARALTLQAAMPAWRRCACWKSRKRPSTTGCFASASNWPQSCTACSRCWSATSAAAPPT